MFNIILKELSAGSGSILKASILSLDGQVIASYAKPSAEGLADSHACTLISAIPVFANRLASETLQGEVDWILMRNSDVQVLMGMLPKDKVLCCMLPVGVGYESILPGFQAALVKINSELL